MRQSTGRDLHCSERITRGWDSPPSCLSESEEESEPTGRPSARRAGVSWKLHGMSIGKGRDQVRYERERVHNKPNKGGLETPYGETKTLDNGETTSEGWGHRPRGASSRRGREDGEGSDDSSGSDYERTPFLDSESESDENEQSDEDASAEQLPERTAEPRAYAAAVGANRYWQDFVSQEPPEARPVLQALRQAGSIPEAFIQWLNSRRHVLPSIGERGTN